MIDNKEIRIGNWFQHNENWCYRSPAEIKPFIFQWEDRDWYSLSECTLSLDDIEPVPLTEDVLKRCGFHKHNNAWVQDDFKENNSKFYFSIWDVSGYYTYNSAEFTILIESLHQLSNLYYSLTGKELNYQPN